MKCTQTRVPLRPGKQMQHFQARVEVRRYVKSSSSFLNFIFYIFFPVTVTYSFVLKRETGVMLPRW